METMTREVKPLPVIRQLPPIHILLYGNVKQLLISDLISELEKPKVIISTTVSLIEGLQSSLFIAQISSV